MSTFDAIAAYALLSILVMALMGFLRWFSRPQQWPDPHDEPMGDASQYRRHG